jgi:DNA-binding CsgD family transcriptional regulator
MTQQATEMADGSLARGYFDRAGEAICRVAISRDEGEALALLQEASHCIGADAAMFCSRVNDVPAEVRFMLACDPRWWLMHERTGDGGQEAPWLDYAAERAEVSCVSQLKGLTSVQRTVFNSLKRFGFQSMLIVPSPTIGTAVPVSVLVLGSRRTGFFEDSTRTALRVMARSLAMELHAWRLSRARHELIRRAQLTATDIDLLRHERKGFRTKDIARNLCMTAPAIDSRFQRLNARLGVASRKAAASLAATYGLV